MTGLPASAHQGLLAKETRFVAASNQFLTAWVGDQMFGLPIIEIQDVINIMPLTPVPLAKPEVAGIMNLRGRVVTAIRLDVFLGVPKPNVSGKEQIIVFEIEHELFALIVHKVGDVLTLDCEDMKETPTNLDPEMVADNVRDIQTGKEPYADYGFAPAYAALGTCSRIN